MKYALTETNGDKKIAPGYYLFIVPCPKGPVKGVPLFGTPDFPSNMRGRGVERCFRVKGLICSCEDERFITASQRASLMLKSFIPVKLPLLSGLQLMYH